MWICVSHGTYSEMCVKVITHLMKQYYILLALHQTRIHLFVRDSYLCCRNFCGHWCLHALRMLGLPPICPSLNSIKGTSIVRGCVELWLVTKLTNVVETVIMNISTLLRWSFELGSSQFKAYLQDKKLIWKTEKIDILDFMKNKLVNT